MAEQRYPERARTSETTNKNGPVSESWGTPEDAVTADFVLVGTTNQEDSVLEISCGWT